MSHKDLIVVEKAINFSVEIYKLTSSFPKSEIFGLIAQMRRASVSIASNIAEGAYRTPKEFIAFLRISKWSAAELIVQLKIAVKL